MDEDFSPRQRFGIIRVDHAMHNQAIKDGGTWYLDLIKGKGVARQPGIL